MATEKTQKANTKKKKSPTKLKSGKIRAPHDSTPQSIHKNRFRIPAGPPKPKFSPALISMKLKEPSPEALAEAINGVD